MSIASRPPGPGPGLLIAGIVVAVALVAIAAYVLFAGVLSGSGDDDDGPYVEAVVGSPQRVNPLFAYLNDTDRDLVALVFSGLTRIGGDGQVLPDLAESWDYSSDGRTIEFTLREGVTWHSGAPFTAADVIFTYSLLADPALPGDPEQAQLWQTLRCNAPDDLTVRCELNEPFAPFLTYASVGIVPKQLLEGTTAATLFNDEFNRAPTGTGPYVLEALGEGQEANLTAFPDYHFGQPGLPSIKMRFFADMGSAVSEVISGQADGLLADSSTAPDDYSSLSADDRLQPFHQNRSAYTVLYLNNRAAPLSDPVVRQAISLATDADAIIADLLGGRAVRADVPIPPGTYAYNDGREPTGRDLGQARRLLEGAGWTLADGADVRTRNDTELRITLITDRDELRGAVADAIAEQLAEAGVGVTVTREDSTVLVRDYLLPKQYEAAVFGFEPGADPDPYPAWHSSQAPGFGRNIAGFIDPDADQVMENGRRSYDLDERQRLYFTFQQIFTESPPSVVLYYPVSTYFITRELIGVSGGVLFDTSSRFRNVHLWALHRQADLAGD